jgi:hypothetical protein
MRKLFGIATAIALVIVLAPSAEAKTKSKHHHAKAQPQYTYIYAGGRQPIVIQRRSWLDPGPEVPVGTYTQYSTMPAYSEVDPVGTYQAGTFMLDTLHPAMGASAEHGFFGY